MQATFKIVKNPDVVVHDNDIKTRVINAINRNFSTLDNWEFGEAFYFTELSTYIMNERIRYCKCCNCSTHNQTFGSLFEIKAESDEIFISLASCS